ncbi:hypothetical protein KFL_001920125 [Klebsormidium nitens]|uniref:Uncharacterized protein n=1 Tax=Klebsormidium nitens TaxID=105231 RepID=A0A1Y1I3I1_KLENI|nr:hypothetical protein KFL_001920125 [Klebsormidium nitens]|eukprot:GAQ84512.1 hypothetical protein KFL_001920125 [Klebsormidium nitens]
MGRYAVAIVFLLLAVCSVKGASNGSCVKLLLPEADLVNKFLINNCTKCTNPLFKGIPRPLQVIKCQPKLVQEKRFGPAYDFYQVEAPSSACEHPPPVETTEHHHHMKEILPETTIERMGPVDLPDPSQGLNQFLEDSDASLRLELCKKSKMSFYVGFPDSCKQLGSPYGRLEAPVKSGARSKSKSFFLAWIQAAGLICIYLSGYWFIILSLSGNAVLLNLLLGVYTLEQLKDVSFSLHAVLLSVREYVEATKPDRWSRANIPRRSGCRFWKGSA